MIRFESRNSITINGAALAVLARYAEADDRPLMTGVRFEPHTGSVVAASRTAIVVAMVGEVADAQPDNAFRIAKDDATRWAKEAGDRGHVLIRSVWGASQGFAAPEQIAAEIYRVGATAPAFTERSVPAQRGVPYVDWLSNFRNTDPSTSAVAVAVDPERLADAAALFRRVHAASEANRRASLPVAARRTDRGWDAPVTIWPGETPEDPIVLAAAIDCQPWRIVLATCKVAGHVPGRHPRGTRRPATTPAAAPSTTTRSRRRASKAAA